MSAAVYPANWWKYPGGYLVPKGWEQIVFPMEEELARMRANVFSVKERYGGLIVHLLEPTDQQHDLARGVMNQCNWMCEDCGAPGVLRTSRYGHLKTVCEEHEVELFHWRKDREW